MSCPLLDKIRHFRKSIVGRLRLYLMLRVISSAPWHVSNQTLHNDFEIQYVTEVVRINANKYKNRSTERSNQLIRAIFNPLADRRLKRLWPEDLAQ